MNIRQFALPLIITAVLLVVGIATLQRMGVKEPAGTTSSWSSAAPSAQTTQPPAQTTSGDNQQAGALDEMVVKLEQRLKDQEGTADDWLLLGKTYQYLGRKEEAGMAYTRAKELGFDPDKLKQAQTDMSQQLNATAPRLAAPNGKMTSLEVAALNQTLTDTKAAGTAEVHGTLTLASEMLGKLPDNATLFIFARGTEPGQAAPFAVLKTQNPSFPMAFQLNDSHAVMPGRNLSSTQDVIIGARLSVSGNASGETGDLEGQSQPVKVSSDAPVQLQINQIRQ